MERETASYSLDLSQPNTTMKLLSTIAAVLISMSAYSQDYVEYDNGTFTQNGKELSLEQIDDLTLLHKAGRGNFRRGNRYIRLHKNPYLRRNNNTLSLYGGAATGTYGVLAIYYGALYAGYSGGYVLLAAGGVGLCAVSYKAFSRVVKYQEMCLPRRDRQFNKVADSLNQAIKAANP